jgi:hypothetical protein
MENIMNLSEIKTVDELIENVDLLKDESLLNIRSIIITSLFNSRTTRILNSLEQRIDESKFDEIYDYLVHFFRQLPIANDGNFQISPMQFYESASNLIDENVYDYDFENLTVLLESKGILLSDIHNKIKNRLRVFPYEYLIKELSTNDKSLDENEEMEYIINELKTLKETEKKEPLLFYPCISISDSFIIAYASLMLGYYCFFNDDFLLKINTKTEIIKDFEQNLNEIKIKFPNAYLDNKKIHYSIFESVMNLENELIIEIVNTFNYSHLNNLKKNGFCNLHSSLDSLMRNVKIVGISLNIENLIKEANYTILKEKQKSAENEATTYKNLINSDILKDLVKEIYKKLRLQEFVVEPGKKKSINPHIKSYINDEKFSVKEITLDILSEEKVKIKIKKKKSIILTYEQFGFSDVKKGKIIPSAPWTMLLKFCKYNISTIDDHIRTAVSRLDKKLQSEFDLNERFFNKDKQKEGFSIYTPEFSFKDRFYNTKKKTI